MRRNPPNSCSFLRIGVRFVAAAALACLAAASQAADEPISGPTGPQRIVSLTPSVTETLFALGAGERVVGVSDHCDFPAQVNGLPHVGTFLLPVIERVLSLRPDLVITSPSPGNRNAVLAIERAGVRTAVVTEGSGELADLRASITETAAAIASPEKGRALIASIDAELEAVSRAVAGRPRPPVAVAVGLEPLVLAGPRSYLGELVVIAGGANVADRLGGKWPRSGWELLVAAAPEVIIDLSAMDETGSVSSRWSAFPAIPAVRDGRIRRAGDVLLRPGPRVGEAAREIAALIHPGNRQASP
jgi:iron complex transport system substrate-binding protein